MSIVHVAPCYDVAARVGYVTREGRGVLVTNSHASLPDFVTDARQRTTAKGRVVQAISIVQSFSPEELCIDSPEDVRTCHFAGTELAREGWPGCDALVVTHTDSAGGCVHNHILVLNDDPSGFACKLRHHPAIVRVNDTVMKSLSLSTIGDDNDAWSARRMLLPKDSFERELGDAIAETIAEGGFYDLSGYREALSRRGVELEEVKCWERSPDGSKRPVLDERGEPAITGWRYHMSYSGDAGTSRTAKRRRRASSLSREFTREGLEASFERELRRVQCEFRGIPFEPEEARGDAYSHTMRKDDIMTDRNRETMKRLKAEHRRSASAQTESIPDEPERHLDLTPPALDRECLLADLAVAREHPDYRLTSPHRPRWREDAERILNSSTDAASSPEFVRYVNGLQRTIERETEEARQVFAADKKKLEAIAHTGRSPLVWVLETVAGRYGEGLPAILALITLMRLRMAAEEARRVQSRALYDSRARMWAAEKRERAVKDAMRAYGHSSPDLPRYEEVRRATLSREAEVYARAIMGVSRSYDREGVLSL